jgi:hypothetical protein
MLVFALSENSPSALTDVDGAVPVRRNPHGQGRTRRNEHVVLLDSTVARLSEEECVERASVHDLHGRAESGAGEHQGGKDESKHDCWDSG